MLADLRSDDEKEKGEDLPDRPVPEKKKPVVQEQPQKKVIDKKPSHASTSIKLERVYAGDVAAGDTEGSVDDETSEQLIVDEEQPTPGVDETAGQNDETDHQMDELDEQYGDEEYINDDTPIDGGVDDETEAAVNAMNNANDSADEQTIDEEHLLPDDPIDINEAEYLASFYQKPKRAKRDSLPFQKSPYCHKCDKWFSTRTNLLRHLQTHDGVKPFNCHICGNGKPT